MYGSDDSDPESENNFGSVGSSVGLSDVEMSSPDQSKLLSSGGHNPPQQPQQSGGGTSTPPPVTEPSASGGAAGGAVTTATVATATVVTAVTTTSTTAVSSAATGAKPKRHQNLNASVLGIEEEVMAVTPVTGGPPKQMQYKNVFPKPEVPDPFPMAMTKQALANLTQEEQKVKIQYERYLNMCVTRDRWVNRLTAIAKKIDDILSRGVDKAVRVDGEAVQTLEQDLNKLCIKALETHDEAIETLERLDPQWVNHEDRWRGEFQQATALWSAKINNFCRELADKMHNQRVAQQQQQAAAQQFAAHQARQQAPPPGASAMAGLPTPPVIPQLQPVPKQGGQMAPQQVPAQVPQQTAPMHVNAFGFPMAPPQTPVDQMNQMLTAMNSYFTMQENLVKKQAESSTMDDFLKSQADLTKQWGRPQAKVPVFDGRGSWDAFIQAFESVYTERNTPPVPRYSTLLEHLRGEPLEVVKFKPVSGNAYVDVKKYLESRYDNPMTCVNRVLKPFLARDRVMSERNTSDMNKILLEICGLQDILKDKDCTGYVLVSLWMDKLPTTCTQSWCKKVMAGDLDWNDQDGFVKELTERVKLANMSDSDKRASERKSASTQQKAQQSKPVAATATGLQAQVQAPKGKGGAQAQAKKPRPKPDMAKCGVCEAPFHPPGQCQKLVALPCGKRYEALFNAGYCIVCLDRTHYAAKCPKGQQTCPEQDCKRKKPHHTLLCRK